MTTGEQLDIAGRAWPILAAAGGALLALIRYAVWAHVRLKSVKRMEKAIPWLVHQVREIADGTRRACYTANIRHDQLNLVTDMLLDAETGDKGHRHEGTLATNDREAVETLRALLRSGRRPGA